MNSTWKKVEQRVANFFNSERNPLSGANSKHSRSDSLHKKLFIETKHRVKHSAVQLWHKTNKLAKKENKIPVVCLAEKNKEGFWIICHSKDLKKIVSYLN